MNADEIKQRIKADDLFTIGALLKLHSLQTPDEQAIRGTAHDNALGFNALDAPILSDIAQFYLRRGKLSPKQVALIRPKLYKYCKQLSSIGGLEPVKKNSWENKRSSETRKKYVEERESEIKVVFPYDPDLVATIRTIPGRRYNKDGKYWVIPKTVSAVTVLVENNFDISDELNDWWESYKDVKNMNPDDVHLEGFQTELYPFQKQGLAFIESREGKALIADDMGLGKTVQALAWLHKHPEYRPALIIVPASVKLHWRNKALMFMNPEPDISILQGQTPNPIDVGDDLVVINYDIVDHWKEVLLKKGFKSLILDEVHRTKNPQAKRSAAVMRIAKRIDNVIALTGTPILNRPIEIFNCLKMLRPQMFKSKWAFAKRYCDLRHNGFGWEMNGATHKEELHRILAEEIMIRRMKSEVLTELPDKQRIPMPIEMDAGMWRHYHSAERDFLAYLADVDPNKVSSASRAQVLAKIEKLKQIALEGKMGESMKWIDDFLEDSGEKLVVFAVHQDAVDSLMEAYKGKAVKIDGRIAQSKRQGIVERFQSDPNIRLFVGNIQAAGEGIDGLQHVCSNAAFLELPWTPGMLEQASDRIYRMEQKAESVNVYYLIVSGTIEERMMRVLDSKRQIIQEIVDGIAAEDQESTLSALLEDFRNGQA